MYQDYGVSGKWEAEEVSEQDEATHATPAFIGGVRSLHSLGNERLDSVISRACKLGWNGASKCKSPAQFMFICTRAIRIRGVDVSRGPNGMDGMG